ncbi:tetratricopeptide repeat protein [Cellulophaga fucicola]|uniref:Tetratricopeptide repeat-containing protein n=1 Tax=Cellulophaga fucicola TaxID=76595 RepID=A0A1K1MZJ8_9FLAO|nr:tetratricopeptide repeat protein [Cellulophaga fucicola]SFW28465.1 Tetratricopeptide repeat-containing protein [Cellulophaga fucicola]
MAFEAEERPDRPIAKFESMLKTDDVYFFDAEDFEDIIHHYLNNGKMSLAKKAIKIGLTQHPSTIELKLLEVEVHVFENNLELAESMLDSLQTIDSNNEEIYIQRANIFSKKDDHSTAIKLLEKALSLSEDAIDIHSLLGMEHLFMDNFEEAKKHFIQCVLFDEQDYASLYNIIYCFDFLEDYDGAIEFLNDYLEKNPYCEVAWHQLGKQYFAKKMYNEAINAFDFAIISDDTFVGAYFEKGKILERLKRYNEAIENYEFTIEIEDPSAFAYLRIGKCHEKLGNTELAKLNYYKTVHEDPLLDKGWLAITNFYMKQKDYLKAKEYITKAINIEEENLFYWEKNAYINEALGLIEEAEMAYQKMVDLGDCELKTWLLWSSLVLKKGDPHSAIQILQQALEFYPSNSDVLYKIAGAHMVLDQTIKAKEFLVKALKANTKKVAMFKLEFPQFKNNVWINNIILEFGNSSK